MAFNNDQFFYAALYWLEALPGGIAYAADVAKAYNMPYMPMHAPQAENEKSLKQSFNNSDRAAFDAVITEAQAAAFFGSCYAALRHGAGETVYDMYGDNTTHIALCRGMTGAREFSRPIETGLEAAGLSRDILPSCFVYLHDNGQMLVRNAGKAVDVSYPGRPETGYTSFPNLDYDALVETGETWRARFEVFYRVVPLVENREYTTSFVGADGKRYTSSQVAGEDDVMVVSHYNRFFDKLRDEQIIAGAGTDLIPTVFISPKSEYAVGYNSHGRSIEKTEKPGIVRWLSEPVVVWRVSEKMQLHYGPSFALAEPGDVLTIRGPGFKPLVTSKESLKAGRTVLVPVEDTNGPRQVATRPNTPSA